jgi:signal recognition particle subunit SEC65
MPPRRRLIPKMRREVLDPIETFLWSLDGIGLDSLINLPVFRTEAEARRAWEGARRAVWAETERFTLPGAAERFDGLTLEGLKFVRSTWNVLPPFDLAEAVRRLAEDRANVERFASTRGGRQITDYLAILRRDLDTIEETAHELADQPHLSRTYPRLWAGAYGAFALEWSQEQTETTQLE